MNDVKFYSEKWEIVNIEEIADVKGGKRIPKGKSLQEEPTSHPYIRVSDMYMGGVKTENILYVPEQVYPSISKYTISNDDLFISVAGTLGLVGSVPVELDGANLTENANKITNIKINKDFLLQILLSPIIQDAIAKEQTNNAQPKLALSKIRTFKIPNPLLPEQEKIANILSTVDAKIEIITQQITETQELKKGLMQRLLTKGIGHTKFKDSSLGRIPESWEVLELGALLNDIKGGGTPSKDVPEYWKKEIPWVTVKDLKKLIINDSIDYISKDGLANSAANLIPGWTLIISTRMAVGKAVFFTKNVSINQDLKALFPKDNLNKFFLFHWFYSNSENILSLASGSTVKGIRLEVLKGLKLALPNIIEQEKIAEILNSVDEKLNVLSEKKATYQELKQGLMQQLLTGKVRVKV